MMPTFPRGEVVSTVSLADARLLTRARSGDPRATAEVWTNWRNPLWSVCRAMAADKAEAIELLKELYADLPRAVRGWARDEPLCCLVATWAFRRLHASLELTDLTGIAVTVPETVATPDAALVSERLDRISPQVRLVYLIDLFFGCPASTTADLLGVSEQDIRQARSSAAWSMVAGGAR